MSQCVLDGIVRCEHCGSMIAPRDAIQQKNSRFLCKDCAEVRTYEGYAIRSGYSRKGKWVPGEKFDTYEEFLEALAKYREDAR